MRISPLSAEAIAYLGYAGTLGPEEVDQPMAICKESLLIDEKYSCSVGRMMTLGELCGRSGDRRMDRFQPGSRRSGAESTLGDRLSSVQAENPDPIILSQPMAVSGGDIPAAFASAKRSLGKRHRKDDPWRLTLPVIECPGNNLDSPAQD